MLSFRGKKIFINGQIKERSCVVQFPSSQQWSLATIFSIFFLLHWQFAAIIYLSQLFWASLNFKHFVLLLSLQINVFTNKRGWASFDGNEYTRDFKLLKYNQTECMRSGGRAEFSLSTEAALDSVKECVCWMAEANNEPVNKYAQLGTRSKV